MRCLGLQEQSHILVRQPIAAGVGTSKTLGDESRKYGQVRATTDGTLVSTANLRLMRLRKTLEDRYDNLNTDTLLAKVLGNLDLVACNSDSATDDAIKETV